MEIQASRNMIGKNLIELDIRAKYGCNVIAIKHNDKLIIPPSAEETLRSDDILVIVGKIRIFELLK